MARASTVFNVAAFAVGATALAVLLHEMDWQATREVIADVGMWFAAIAAIDLVSVGCDAAVIHAFTTEQVGTVSFFRVFAAQASGLAINRLTPGNTLGEPTKFTMLVQFVPKDVAITSLVKYALTNSVVGITTIVVGVLATLALVELPDRVELFVWIVTVAMVAGVIAAAVIVRRGALGSVIDLLAKINLVGAARAARWRARIATIDHDVRRLNNRRAFAAAIASRALNGLGTVVLLFASRMPMSVTVVVATLSVGTLITGVSNVIPLGMGLADGGDVALYRMLKLPVSAGLAFAMIYRLRTIALAAMGLTVMAVANVASRGDRDRVRSGE